MSARQPRIARWTAVFTAFCLAACLLAPLTAQSERAEKARQLMNEGRYEKAFRELTRQPSDEPFELRLILELHRRAGRLEEADRAARRLLGRLELGALRTPAEIAQAAFAAWHLDQWHRANDLYISASEGGDAPASLYLDWGNLYLEKYNAAEAEDIFNDALKVCEQGSPEAAAALTGLAASFKTQSKPGFAQSLEQALEIDPDNLEAITLKASWAISAAGWEEAESLIEKGLEANKNFLPLLEQKASMHYFRGEDEKFRKVRQRILEINPRDADLFEALGNAAVLKRRMSEADEFFREAVRLNPRQWSALASLGLNKLRLGEFEEGRRILERAYENDPFNIWTVNTLRLVDSFERFESFESEHFKIMLRKDEAPVLRPYVERLLERCVRELESKYGHQLEGRYHFEMYPDHEDFAVRALGMPGLGALGVAVGRIVAMDSPSARPRGQFHWGSTAWHEVAHVIALSMSDQKVPRWFTEGLSMMEERLPHPGWGDPISMAFIDAYQNDDLLPLEDLNDGFQRPDSPQRLSLSYLQAGWFCEFLVQRWGFEKVPEMLKAYGREKTDAEVFKQVLGMEITEVDKQFRQAMAEELDPLIERLGRPADSESPLARMLQGSDIEQLRGAVLAQPDTFFPRLKLGRLLVEEGRLEEAEPHLLKALELHPAFAESGSPYHLLANIYREQDRREELGDILLKWWRRNPKRVDAALELAGMLAEKDKGGLAIDILEEAMYADPLREDVHRKLAELYLAREAGEAAEREYRVLLALEPNDIAGARYGLARGLHLQGRSEEAKRQVLLSLEIAPSFVQAQQLLLELVKP